MAEIIAVCGKICSGKTWYARRLAKERRAVILSTDEVTWDLFDNEQGEGYDALALRVNAYLRKKAGEIALCGCPVILDWGFWKKAQRQELTACYAALGLRVEWHYIDISDADWEQNLAERNARVAAGQGGSDFYVDAGLKQKVLELFEIPDRAEIDVWHPYAR